MSRPERAPSPRRPSDDNRPGDLDRVALRARLRAARRAISGDRRARIEASVATRLCAHPWFAEANRVLAYRAFDGELGVDAVVQRALEAGKQVLFARAVPDAPLAFVVPWRWRSSASGCPVPEGPPTDFAAHDLMLVPGVGFTLDGHRLGLGGGHYDRTLAQRSVRSVGLAFACQLVAKLPLCAWDMRVRALVTEQGWRDADAPPDRSPLD